MTKIKIEDRSVVVPGEVLCEGMDNLPGDGAYRAGDKILASRLGLYSEDGRLCKVIPLNSVYIPKAGDNIIGKVEDIAYNNWKIEFGWPFKAMINVRDASRSYIENGADLSKFYAVNEMVLAKITKVTGARSIELSMTAPGARKLVGGLIIDCNPAKVPRIIGRQGSMITLIKEHTGCNILVGQNGKVWIKGDEPAKEALAVRAIHEIENKSQLSGLTEEITKFLEGGK